MQQYAAWCHDRDYSLYYIQTAAAATGKTYNA